MQRSAGNLADIPVQPAGPRPPERQMFDGKKSFDALFAEILQLAAESNPHIDKPTLRRAYRFAAERHRDHFRMSGEPFIVHALEVTRTLVEMRLDTQTLAAGLLHDVVEDTDTHLDEIEVQFGEDVALIVDGVTKIGEFQLQNREDRQIDTFRKMLLSIAKDVRVILVKFADRIHNLRTLEHLRKDQQERIARESLDVYAPLAHRFGMARVRRDLEDLSFRFVDPEAYEELRQLLDARREELRTGIEIMRTEVVSALQTHGIDAEVEWRIKHLYSVYRKMTAQRRSFDEIYDLLAMRIIVNNVDDCYKVMAYLHQAYRPMHGRFKDYIANPKHNGYQSLHTTVHSVDNRIVEVQIRTHRMHQIAEEGIARHWLYKEGRVTHDIDLQTKWVRQFLEWAEEIRDPKEFVEQLKIDLFPDEVFVQTPKGDVISLPKGGTALDFAFAVHTEVGLHAATAIVNGKAEPLGEELDSSDTVKIITSPNQKPSRDWLSMVKTSRARSKIKKWLREQEHVFNLDLGKDLLDRRLRKSRLHLSDADWDKLVESFNVKDREHLYAAVGSGDIAINRILDHLKPQIPEQKRRQDQPLSEDEHAITILHLDDPMVRFAQCCHPVPGDPVFGFITRGRGVSVHHRDCPNAETLMRESDRLIDVTWEPQAESETKGPFRTAIVVRSDDRVGILGEVSSAISSAGANIRHAEVRTEISGGYMAFLIEVKDLRQLRRVITKARGVLGVAEVYRVASAQDEDELHSIVQGLPLPAGDEEE